MCHFSKWHIRGFRSKATISSKMAYIRFVKKGATFFLKKRQRLFLKPFMWCFKKWHIRGFRSKATICLADTLMHAKEDTLMAFPNIMGHNETSCNTASHCDTCCLKMVRENNLKTRENPEIRIYGRPAIVGYPRPMHYHTSTVGYLDCKTSF